MKKLKTLKILVLLSVLFLTCSCATCAVYVPDVENIKARNKTKIEKVKTEKELFQCLKDWLLDYEEALKKLIIDVRAADGSSITVVEEKGNGRK